MRVLLTTFLIFAGWPAAGQPARPAARPKSYKDLKFKPLKELRLPDIPTFTLSNGMKVYLLENHELPLVRGSARIRTGNVFDPADKVGLSDLFGDVMRSGGTKSRTGDQLNELLEGIAASVESNIGETSGSVSFNTLKEHSDTVLGVFKEILAEPEFRQDKLDIARNQMRSLISRRNDSAGGIASREFERLVYGADTPWGRQMEYETVERITRQDLIDYHRRYVFPANIMLAVQGDFETSAMRTKLETLFADWNTRQPPVPAFPPVTYKARPGIYLADKKDVTQTFFRLGHLNGMLSDKDYPALEVMTDILGGGGFTSRLLKKVRSDLGLAYNVGAVWGADYVKPGTFFISGSTKSQSTIDSLKAIREEVDRIRTTEVSDEELRVARDSTLNSFVFNFDSPSKVLSRLVTYEYFGYPKDFIFQYQKAIERVTKADVLRVAKEYLKPEEMVIVTVGKQEDFGTPLTTLNLPVTKLDLTIPEPKRESATADAASIGKGKQVLQTLQKAVGGSDKLAAVKDYSHAAEVTITAMQGIKVTQVIKMLPPQARIEQQLPFGKIIIYYDGKGGGFLQQPQGSVPLPPQAVKQAKEELFRHHPTLWLSDRDPERVVNATGPNTIEISDKQNNWIQLTLDPATGLLAKTNYRGDAGATEAVYSDWKDADGIKLPHKIILTQGGKPAAEVVVTGYKLNSGLKAEELAQKP
ncbi:MAG TPA: pitrilysin family protein [Bryobacteraceae bacterium]|nr:pitrilysin family protein [Bryobacteraceae bacterium]